MRLTIIALTVLAVACNKEKKESESESTGTDTVAGGEVGLETNPVAASYPDGLTVTSFQEVDEDGVAASAAVSSGKVGIDYDATNLRLTANQSFALAPGDKPKDGGGEGGGDVPGGKCYAGYDEALADHSQRGQDAPVKPKPPRQAQTDARDRINGKAEECFGEDLYNATRIMRHATEQSLENLDGYGDCFLPDWGIVDGFMSREGEAGKDVCVVGYARREFVELGSYVDFAKALSEGLLCQALKDKVITKAMAPGDELVLDDTLKKLPVRDDVKVAPKSARIKRVAGSTTEYVTEMILTMTTPVQKVEKELELKVVIDHKPSDDTNATYSGKMQFSRPGYSQQVGIGNFALSVDYSKSTDDIGDRVKYELRSGLFKTGKEPFGSDGVVDFNVFGTTAIGNESVARMNLVAYDGYPVLDVSRLAYWVNFGGGYDESARGMVFDVRREDGKVKGCAVAGAMMGGKSNGTSIRKSIAENLALIPAGHERPFMCEDDLKHGNQMWLQCFTRDDAGTYVPDSTLIKDTAAGYDFIDGKDVVAIAPRLARVPRPPRYEPGRFGNDGDLGKD